MATIAFHADEKVILVGKLQRYFDDELHQRIGQFDAEFLLDFIAREMGAHFYNRGLYDAQAVLAARVDDLQDAILQLEQPVDPARR